MCIILRVKRNFSQCTHPPSCQLPAIHLLSAPATLYGNLVSNRMDNINIDRDGSIDGWIDRWADK